MLKAFEAGVVLHMVPNALGGSVDRDGNLFVEIPYADMI